MYSSPRFATYGLIPWIGPDRTSWRERRFKSAPLRLTGAPLGGAALFTARFIEVEVPLELAAFFELDFVFATFFGAAALRDADFFDVFFFDLPTFDLPVALREAVFFAVTFLLDAFFAADLRAVFFADRPADFRATVFFDDFLRAAVLLLDVAFTTDFGLDF